MRDPIEELGSFDPGVPMSPLPAPEVRARGDRLRKRNTALIVAGAVAAVLLVAVPVAVFAGDDGGKPQPAGPGLTDSVLLTADELPDRERLTEWQEAEPEGGVLACAPADATLDPEAAVRRDFTADIPGVPADDMPASFVRTEVMQLAGEQAARDAYDQAENWILDCPGGEDPGEQSSAVHFFDIKDGAGEWRPRIFLAPEYCGGGDCDAAMFDRMGVARIDDRVVLVSFAEVGGPLEPEGLDATMDELFQAAVTKAGGEITGASGSGEATQEPAPEPAALDFPIDTGLPAADGDEVQQEGPGVDVEGIILPDGFCGDSWPPEAPVGRLAVKQTGPEFARWRELVTFESADQAATHVAGLRAAVQECPTLAGDEDADSIFVSHDVDSGYDDATFSYTYSEGLGGVVYQFVRVGHAVLATAQAGEWSPETVERGAEELNGENTQLTPLMCEYAEAGC